MARNGSGTYSNPYPNFVSGTVISSTEVDANNSDVATALTQSIAVDGQTTVTANLPMNANKFTGLAVGAAATDSLSLGQAQAEAFIWCGTAGGTADAITLAPSPAITAYAAGQRFVWMASSSVNTGATTVAISGLGAIALQDNGAALVAGNHAASKMFMGILNTTSTVQIMQVQSSGTDPLIISSLTVNGASQLNGTLTAGINGTGYDVILYGDTAGKNLTWDQSADSLIVTGTTTLVGTTNLDAVDIDGAVQIDGIVQVGVDGTGYDVKLFGDASGSYALWDQSSDDLILAGAAGLSVAGGSVLTGVTTHGGNVVSDADSTDDLGTTSVRWANLFVDGITATDQVTATGFTGTLDGILGSGAAAAATVTTLVTSGIVSVDDTTTSTSGTTGSIHTDGGLGVAGTSTLVGVTTHGDDVVSDTDSTDDLGTTGVRWANLFVDGITATDQITATGFTGTLDGILGSGTPAAATVTTIDASGVATATTFEPDGDTAAGDNAAIGYTAAEGLILTGQGSTSDITFKNDADATVMSIPTGTTNVGIGTTAPAQILETKELDQSGFTGIRINNPNGNVGSAGIEFQVDATYSKAAIYQLRAHGNGGGAIVFVNDSNFDAANWVAGDEKMRITPAGNVGIGTTAPARPFVVASGAAMKLSTAYGALFNDTGNDGGVIIGSDHTVGSIQGTDAAGTTAKNLMLQKEGGSVGIGTTPSYQLHVNTDSAGKPGTGGVWTVISDERIKSDIVPANLDRCYEIVKSVPLKHFSYAPGVYTDEQINDKQNLGWIAQDVQKVFPKAVSIKPFTLKPDIPDGEEEYDEQDFTIETVEKTETSIQVIDGKPVQISKPAQSENKVMLFDTVDVLDEDGVAVMDGDKPLTHQMPRMITKTRPKVRHDVIEDCLDLNGGQMIAALYGAVQALMEKVESMTTRIASLENK